MTRKPHTTWWVTGVLCVASAIALALSLVGAARADLPPRPELPGPSTSRTGRSGAGTQIMLRATFSSDWPWYQVPWQDLWTVVEWQGTDGTWHTVEGWQGTLDDVTATEDEIVVGKKMWSVYRSDLGKGPFRWLVYEGRGDRLVASSESFDLPESVGQWVISDISLKP